VIFTDFTFFIFLAVVFAGYWLLQDKEERLGLLLIASTVFYGWWDWRFLGLIGAVILVSWAVAKFVSKRHPGDQVRRYALIGGIGFNLSVIAAFKYFGFFAESARTMLATVGVDPGWTALNLLLPVGISFYVFQAISYIVDVARGDMPPEYRLRRVALYIAFFPQLVAGPIVRAASFFPQMEREKTLSSALFFAGLRAFVLGFAYKAGIADNLAQFVDPIYGNALVDGDTQLAAWSNAALIGATLAFAGLIYFDFAGYSLMAIGVARWFGFYIPKTLTTRTQVLQLRIFGGVGTFLYRAGCATIYTFRWAATDWAKPRPIATLWRRWCSVVFGTAPHGPLSPGVRCMARL